MKHIPNVSLCHKHGNQMIITSIGHPPNQHPKSPIRAELTAIESVLACGCKRWQGTERAIICSHLQMSIKPISDRDEVVATWVNCKD